MIFERMVTDMKEVRILAPAGMLGYGIRKKVLTPDWI